VQVLVDKESAPDVYNMRPDDMMSVGPFEGTGLDMRSSGVLGVFRCAWLLQGPSSCRVRGGMGPSASGVGNDAAVSCLSFDRVPLTSMSAHTQGRCRALLQN
jgi:hypothetical protein